MRSAARWAGVAMMCGVLGAAPAARQPEMRTISGELVEIACATGKGADGRGNGHALCALECARKGAPLGVLTEEALYEVTGDFAAGRNAKLLDFVAKTVLVTGELTERDGRRLLNVKTIRMK